MRILIELLDLLRWLYGSPPDAPAFLLCSACGCLMETPSGLPVRCACDEGERARQAELRELEREAA